MMRFEGFAKVRPDRCSPSATASSRHVDSERSYFDETRSSATHDTSFFFEDPFASCFREHEQK